MARMCRPMAGDEAEAVGDDAAMAEALEIIHHQ